MRALEVQCIPVTRRFPLLRRQRLALCVLAVCLAPLLLAITPAHAQTAAVVTTQPLDRTVAEGDASNTAVFTVALATQPSHDVTVTVTTPAGLELDGPDSPTAFTGSELLTFTASTWNSPQTVTVRAVEDSTDSPRSLSVQYSSTSVSDSDYSSLTGTAATITVIDNDPTYVRVSAHFRDIAEGETKDITVVLRRGLVRGEALSVPLMFIDFGEKVAIYNTDFTLTCPSGLPTGVTCSGFETTVPTVTFTGPGSGATATSFTLTLTATRDNVDDDGEDVFLFDPAPRTTGLDGGLIVVPDVPVFSITDSAPTSPGATAPRVTIDGVPGKINGTAPFTATFTFSQAVTGFTTDDVTVAGGAKGTFSAASATRYTLVVTPAGGSDAVVTVRAGAATGSGRTGPASAVSARATWDATPPTLSITGVPAAIGSTASFTATFTFSEAVTGFNTDDVTVDGGSAGAVSGSGDEYTATITPEGSADVTVTVRADAATDGANAGPASAESATAVWDDSQPAAVIVSGSPVSLVEGGDAGSYTVALATDPGGVVTVTPSSSDPGAVAVSGALTLTSTNWNEPQTVTVSAVDDGDRADESVVVTHAVVGYPGVSSAPDVAVTVADDDEDEDEDDAAVGNPALVASADSLVLTEGGEGSYTLVLVERPTNEVTVSITAVGGAALDVSPPSLTFGVGDWDRPQSVTVAALEDDDGADESGSLTHSAAGGGYEGVGAEVAVTVTDDDEASLAVSETSLSLDEGGSASYTVALATRPPSAVTVEIAVSGGAGVELSASSLTFTPSNWSEAQTVTVSANEDDDAADGTGTLRHAASGGGYDAVAVEVGVSVSDNDEPALNVSAASLSLDEGGSASYEVALATRPPSAVTVEIAASGGAGVGLSASSLTFGADDWDAPQSVTVTALEDDDGVDESGSLTHSATGGGYEGVSAEVAVSVSDDDEPSLAVSETSLSLDEGGSASYAVALATRPPSAVTVEIAASGGAGVGLSASSLTFTPSSWSEAQTVTVSANKDDDRVDETGTLRHAASGGGYDGVSAQVTVSVADDGNAEAVAAISAWNARFGRTVAEHLLEGIGDRVNAKRKALSVPAGDASESGEGSGVSFQAGFAGQNISFAAPTAAPTAMGVDAAGMGPGMGEPGGIPSLGQPKSSSNMFGAAFASSFFEAAGQLADGSYWGAWGRGSFTDLQGTTAAGLRLDGDVLTGQLGADWSNGRMLFGLSLSHSKGDGDYGGDGGREGALESTMTALTPYASVGSEQFSMWGALSAGRGDTMVAPHQGAVIEADTEMDIAAAGLRGQLVNLDNGFGLSILSDAMAMRSSSEETVQLPGIDADVSRVRLSVEGAWIRRMADGGEFSARLEGGLRRDGGDAEEGIGSEISGGLAWTRGGLTFEVEGRTLVTHEDDGFGQTGASAYLAWDPRLASELGPAVSLRQHWGIATGSGLEQMFQMRDLGQFGMESGAARLDAELGWGLPMFGGRFVGTPYLLHGTHQGGRVQTFGWRLGSLDENNALDLSLTVKAMRRVSDTGLSEEGFALGTHLRF